MPRQGVPYPSREICSLKCQIDALQRQINELMKSINGVQGDGQGNLSLISGDPAVVINNDASQNQIEIALDQSELPAAAVRMVNGMTGAVVLGANDIYAGANTVGFEIADLKAENLLRKQGITNEISNRQAADAALQSNINALQTSIPGEAAQAVANDPTVQQLAVDVPNKLNKITSGNALKAYTHTGATQGEKSVVDGTTADSIGIRDANGRMQAADPASGATDKTLVTANWVSQTGVNAPNNLAHRLGNEEIADKKTFYQPTGWFFGSNSTAIPTTDRFNIVSIPRSFISGTRGHLGIWLKNRTRADSLVLSIYHHADAAQDLEVVVPHQGGTTKTWTLSQDNDNIYLSFNGDNSTGADGWYAQGIFSVQTNLRAINTAFQSTGIVGTEIRSLTL